MSKIRSIITILGREKSIKILLQYAEENSERIADFVKTKPDVLGGLGILDKMKILSLPKSQQMQWLMENKLDFTMKVMEEYLNSNEQHVTEYIKSHPDCPEDVTF